MGFLYLVIYNFYNKKNKIDLRKTHAGYNTCSLAINLGSTPRWLGYIYLTIYQLLLLFRNLSELFFYLRVKRIIVVCVAKVRWRTLTVEEMLKNEKPQWISDHYRVSTHVVKRILLARCFNFLKQKLFRCINWRV